MKKAAAVATLAVAAASLGVARAHSASRQADLAPDAAVRRVIEAGADSLDVSLDALAQSLGAGASVGPREAFRAARLRYKRLEGALEFYNPALAAAFNSRRQEVDDDDAPPPSSLGAAGFPAVEALLWPSLDPSVADSAARAVRSMRTLVARARSMAPALVVTDAQVIEIARLEIARVSSLGIAGFDTPRTHDAATEAAAALDGVRALVDAYARSHWRQFAPKCDSIDHTLLRASTYLRANPDFDHFNRLAFIAFYAAPAASAVDHLRRDAHVTPIRIQRGWRADASSIYSPNAFDPAVYTPATSPPQTRELIALGERLFAEPRLSGTGTRSCASCHVPSKAFTDGLERAARLDGHGRVARNTPTLINAALQPSQFADERAASLEDQVLEVVRSVAEMGGSVERAATVLDRSADYKGAFARAFADSSGASPVTPLHVRQALAAYVRSLVSMDSRFDRAARGDTLALSAAERRGFELFMGKAGCGTCHFAPLFSGLTPPLYLNSDVEVIGTTTSPSARVVDPDSGRAAIDHLPMHVRAFKTPSLRNVARTAPYMHNGAFGTLDDVVAFYDRGGGVGSGAKVPNQTLSADSLHLSADERRAIVAFLGSLSSR